MAATSSPICCLWPSYARAIFAGVPLAMALSVSAQTSLPKDSPFLPSGTAAIVGGAAETLEFAGVSTVGKRTDLIIHDKTAKNNRWVGVGETVEGITVVAYDPKIEQAVVRMGGLQRVLTLRRGAGPVNQPAPVAPVQMGFATPTPPPTPTAPPPPVSLPAAPVPTAAAAVPHSPPIIPQPMTAAQVQERQETEARMLVSDLMEIGMVQRRAYERAQRKDLEAKARSANEPPANAPAEPAAKPNG